MFYRHKVNQSVTEAKASPGDDWVKIDPPEDVTPPPPGVFDSGGALAPGANRVENPTGKAEPAKPRRARKPRKAAAKKATARTKAAETATPTS